MKKNELYTEELKNKVNSLRIEDKELLIETLFAATMNAIRAYHLSIGHSDREINMHVQTEASRLNELITDRVRKTVDIPNTIVHDFDRATPTDESFIWDAKFDIETLIKQVAKNS